MRRFNEKTMSASERGRARKKVEAEVKKQAEEKQAESYRLCEKLTESFWKDFWNGAELSVLVNRVEFALQNSGYKGWKEEFFDIIGEKIMEMPEQFIRNREKLNESEQGFDIDNLGDIRINFNGLFVPEFANFKENNSIQLYTASKSTNEAYALFGLTFETLTTSSLKQAYRRLVQMYHPDKNKAAYAPAIFQKVQKYHTYLERELRRKVA